MLTLLLEKVRDALRQDVGLDYVRDVDIAIVPSLHHLPGQGPKMPCIGIKDGAVQWKELSGGVMEGVVEVHVIVYTSLLKDQERSVLGDVSSGQPGILTVAEDSCAALLGNLLGLEPEVQDARITKEHPSETYLKDDGSGTQRKQLTITYTIEREGTCGY